MADSAATPKAGGVGRLSEHRAVIRDTEDLALFYQAFDALKDVAVDGAAARAMLTRFATEIRAGQAAGRSEE